MTKKMNLIDQALTALIIGATSLSLAHADENDDLLDRLGGQSDEQVDSSVPAATPTTQPVTPITDTSSTVTPTSLNAGAESTVTPTSTVTAAESTVAPTSPSPVTHRPSVRSGSKKSFTRNRSYQGAITQTETGYSLKGGLKIDETLGGEHAKLDISVGSPIMRAHATFNGKPLVLVTRDQNHSSGVDFKHQLVFRPLKSSAMITLPQGNAPGRQHLVIHPELAYQLELRGGKLAMSGQLGAGPQIGGACDGDACGTVAGIRFEIAAAGSYELSQKLAAKMKLELAQTLPLLDHLESVSSACATAGLELNLGSESSPLQVEGGFYVQSITFDLKDNNAENKDSGSANEAGLYGKIAF